MSKPEIYVSVDIEADGRIPGRNSMLSFASAAFTLEKELVAVYAANLEFLEGASGDAETIKWWEGQPAAWAACRVDTVSPDIAMPDFAEHLESVVGGRGKPVFMGFPAAYDFAWINWYLHRFAGRNPFGISGLCLKSVAAGYLKIDFRQASKRNFPKRWFDRLPHSHVALDDAIEQGAMGINMLREVRSLTSIRTIANKTNIKIPALDGSA